MSADASPWQHITYAGIGPVLCAQCHSPVADAEPGLHACVCGARETPEAVDPRVAQLAAMTERVRLLEAAMAESAPRVRC